LAFVPFQAPKLAGLNLVLQILGGLQKCGFKRVVYGLGVQVRAMNQQRRLACMTGRLRVWTRAGHLQSHLDTEGWFCFLLVLEDYVGRGNRRQTMQVVESILHLAVPGGLGIEAEISKRGFHISIGVGSYY
jgi:hypothetical protein